MMKALSIGQTGMSAQEFQLGIHSANLANGSTPGYKAAKANMEDLAYQNYRQVGASTSEQSVLPTGLQLGSGVRVSSTSRSFSQGNLQLSSGPTDIAINGNGFFQLTMPDGTIGYTRDGSFQIDSQGRMVNSGGLPVAGGITVPAGATGVTVASNGTVSALVAGSQTPTSIGTITLANFINPAGLEPKGQNIYTESVASGQPNVGTAGADGLGSLMQGYLESSNVNLVQELVGMIQTQRAYEMNSKAIQTADQMLQKLAQL
jgi:flagellar basal-body rod protein FlgG